MAIITIRNLEDDLKRRLRTLAASVANVYGGSGATRNNADDEGYDIALAELWDKAKGP